MGGDGGFGHCKRSISHGMDIWKDIRKEWDEFVAFTSSVVGEGSSVRVKF